MKMFRLNLQGLRILCGREAITEYILWKSGRQELDVMNGAPGYIFEMYYSVVQIGEDYIYFVNIGRI